MAQWDTRLPPGVPRNEKGEPDLNGAGPENGRWKARPLGSLAGRWEYAWVAARPRPPSHRQDRRLQDSATSRRTSRKDCPSSPKARHCSKSGRRATARTTPRPTACRWGSFSSTPRARRESSSRRRDVLVILYEASSGLRQIFTDGRALPDNDPQPWWYGYSVGRWEGDTLVVETTGLRDGGWLDIIGNPVE